MYGYTVYVFPSRFPQFIWDSVLLLFSCLSDFIFISVQRKKNCWLNLLVVEYSGATFPTTKYPQPTKPQQLLLDTLTSCSEKNNNKCYIPLYCFFTNVSLCLLMIPNSLQLGNPHLQSSIESTCCNISAFCISSAAKDLNKGYRWISLG